MAASTDILFEAFKSEKLTLPNRIVMAPMTRSFSPGHVPGDNVVEYYRRRAEGGVGLILTEGVSPNMTTATGTPNVPNIVTDEAKSSLEKRLFLASRERAAKSVYSSGMKAHSAIRQSLSFQTSHHGPHQVTKCRVSHFGHQ